MDRQRYTPWLVFAGYALLLFVLIGMSFYCLTLFVIPICEALKISRVAFSLIYTFSGVGSTLVTLLLVKMLRVLSARRLALIGGLLGAGAYLLLAEVQSLYALYAISVLLGISTSLGGTAVSQIGLVPWFQKRQGIVFGAAGAASGLGAAACSPLLAELLTRCGYAGAARFEAAVLLITTLLVFFFLIKEDPETLGLAPYGGRPAPAESETVAAEPPPGATVREALRSPKLYWMVLGAAIVAISYQIFSLHHSPMIQDKGFSLAEASLCLSVFSLSNMGNKLLSGLLQDRLGVRTVCLFCAGSVGLGICFLLYGKSLAAMIAFSFLLGFWPSIIVLYGVFAGNHLFGARESKAWISIGQVGVCFGSLMGPWFSGVFYSMTGSYTFLLYILLGSVALFFLICLFLFSERTKYSEKR